MFKLVTTCPRTNQTATADFRCASKAGAAFDAATEDGEAPRFIGEEPIRVDF